MFRMDIRGVRSARRTYTTAALALTTLLTGLLSGCAGSPHPAADGASGHSSHADHAGGAPSPDGGLPGVGPRLSARIAEDTRQAVVVYGDGRDSADSTLVLYHRDGDDHWTKQRSWKAHNGKRGWTTHHHEGDKRSPSGVYTLSDAGGVLPDPGTALPYTHSAAFTPPSYWSPRTRHDFDYVIAIDYNRRTGVSPLDPTRPQGQSKGGSIWLHMDHGSGTSGCVSLSEDGMRYLLRHLKPDDHPVVVMGTRALLRT
jgi:L,D-peptidoglycan transpeptidase YkuD (ErfK/YbiS/YcfS/YnhG family)